jgi:hypothetical protein
MWREQEQVNPTNLRDGVLPDLLLSEIERLMLDF